jgi:hypothetical protein
LKDFELFKKEFKKWQEKFGLNGWEVFFKYEKPQMGGFASVNVNLLDKTVTVRLNDELEEKDKPFKDIKRDAKHEAIHLLLAEFSELAYNRFINSDELYRAEEELVHKLEELIK